VWPLEAYFPSTIAIWIAHSLFPGDVSDSEAINCAVRAVAMGKEGMKDEVLKRWRRVPIDVSLQRYRRSGAVIVKVCSLVVAAAFFMGVLTLSGIAYLTHQSFLISPSVPYIKSIDQTTLDTMFAKAGAVVDEIETSLPPKSVGWRRILPWNWDVLPSIPESKIQSFKTVRAWQHGSLSYFNPRGDAVKDLDGLPSSQSLQDLDDALRPLSWLNQNGYIIVTGRVRSIIAGWFFVTFGFIVAMWILGRVPASEVIRETFTLWSGLTQTVRRLFPPTAGAATYGRTYLSVGRRMTALSVMMVVFLTPSMLVEARPFPSLALPVVSLLGVLFSELVAWINWPSNPLVATLEEVQERPNIR